MQSTVFLHRPLVLKTLIYSILDQHYFNILNKQDIMKKSKKKEGWTAIGVFVVLLIIGAIIASQNDYTPKDHHANNAESSSSFDHKK